MKQSRGFTLIEVLTVVGIIAILAAMLFLGARSMTNTGKKNVTRTMLLDLKNMVGEREAAIGPTQVHNDIDVFFTTAGANASTASVIGDVDPQFPLQRYPSVTYSASTGPAGDNAVGTTQFVMVYLMSIPANRTAVTNLPAKQFLEAQSGGTLSPQVLMDGYGYPIIAVPSGGLTNVTVNGAAQPAVRSPDGKPFFASPGPDGDFSKGDDNVYSFEN